MFQYPTNCRRRMTQTVVSRLVHRERLHCSVIHIFTSFLCVACPCRTISSVFISSGIKQWEFLNPINCERTKKKVFIVPDLKIRIQITAIVVLFSFFLLAHIYFGEIYGRKTSATSWCDTFRRCISVSFSLPYSAFRVRARSFSCSVDEIFKFYYL